MREMSTLGAMQLAAVAVGLVVGFSSGIGDQPAAARAAGQRPQALPWSFSKLVKRPAPAVRNDVWPRGDIDRFVLARLEDEGIEPNSDADRYALIRRLAFDLTGLPPSADEVEAFVTDPSSDDDALARVVDQYLASPRFGERWARHWLDVVRYADSTGRTWNAPFTYAWRYRDWVIDALNADTPYDRFIVQQIAGDLLPAKSVDERRANLIATGLLALGAHDLGNLSHEQFLMDVIDDQIDVTSRAILGLTISCARCHDHKYDPVSMRDYYALAGVFYSTRMLPGVSYHGQGNGYVDHEELIVLPIANGGRSAAPTIIPGVHSMEDYQAAWRQGERAIRFTTDMNLAMGVGEGDVADCELRIKGDPHDRGPTPPRGSWQITGLPRPTPPPKQSSGRLELARWLTSANHPLTPRVLVNRVWMHLMGRGLVANPDDFGSTSEPPTHPELLDHLALRFIADRWSIKALIRSIVLSRSYRLSSATVATDATADSPSAKDPDNRFYGRANLRRLEFELLRDSLLAAAGELANDRPTGIQVSGIGGKSMKSSCASLLELDSPYRTVYLPVLRSRVPETYSVFDFPDPCQIIGRREVTTVAPQALFFMNNRFVIDCAESTAELLLRAPLESDASRVDWLYRRLFARQPSSAERADAITFLEQIASNPAAAQQPHDRWSTLAQALMAGAEFRYLR